MAAFYNDHEKYYQEISFGETAWTYDQAYLRIREQVRISGSVLEVGCGRASILQYERELVPRYTGLDFSPELLAENAARHSPAQFFALNQNGRFPVPSETYDLVFSVYVLEHTVFPAQFLDECLRVLKPTGKLIIYCPNFLGRGWVTSQRVGFSGLSVRQKLKGWKWIDAFVSTWDRAVRIPTACLQARKQAERRPQFLINLAPTCFVDPFLPDRDATYLTYAPEIVAHVGSRATLHPESRIRNSDLKYYLAFTKV